MFAKERINRLEIDLTASCNARCPICARNYNYLQIKYNERPLHEITAQLDEYVNLKFIHLVGAFSEPTLYKEFFGLCRYLVGREIAVEVCTNGDTHDEDWWSELGKILTHRDSVYFSVCGSTQELHETYRVGCSLQNLLNNARSFRRSNPYGIDYIQHIEFEYNKEDLKSDEMKKIMAEFSHINLTLTYFTRDKSIYKNQFNIDKLLVSDEHLVKYKAADRLSRSKWENRETQKCEMHCQSIEDKSVHIDQFGKVYPCYIWLEESKEKEWNGSYKDIQDFKYECCRFCEKNTKKLIDLWGCEVL